MHRRLAAAVTLSVTLLLGACTDDAPKPPPPPSSGPKMPSASPTQSSPTSASVSSEDSEHSDLLEIQALYKSEFTEEAQALKRGGADKLPSGIRKRTTGRYQKDLLETLRSEKKDGTRQTVGGKLLGIAMGRWTPSRVTLQSCEDYSGVKTVDKTGKPVKQKPGVRVVQTITVVKSGASWRIESSNARVVNDFQDEPCNGKWYS